MYGYRHSVLINITPNQATTRKSKNTSRENLVRILSMVYWFEAVSTHSEVYFGWHFDIRRLRLLMENFIYSINCQMDNLLFHLLTLIRLHWVLPYKGSTRSYRSKAAPGDLYHRKCKNMKGNLGIIK